MSENEPPALTSVSTEYPSVATVQRVSGTGSFPSECVLIREGVVLNGRFSLERLLGSGGMGEVWLGRDLVLGRHVAAKVIRPLDPALRERTRLEDGLRVSFAEEAKIGASLAHPAIATVFDFGFFQDEPFIIFEYIDGDTLREYLRRRGRLSLQDAQLIIGSLARALGFAHANHVVHRDIKPDNIRATAQGHFKILDLGLAKEFRSHVDWGGLAGTPSYIAPEQAAGLPCDGRADQYSLAVIAYEMVVGRRPFADPDWRRVVRMQIETPPPSPRLYVPEGVSDALLRALAKNPSQRFNTCEDFAVAFGCQPLNDTARVPEPLKITTMRTPLFGGRPSGRAPIFGVRVGLTAHDLCIVYLDEIRVLPLSCVFGLAERGIFGVEIRYASHGNEGSEFLNFWSPWHRQSWMEQIRPLICTTRQEAERSRGMLEARPRVIQMQGAAAVRHQVLGSVAFAGPRRSDTVSGIEMQAALLGANAVSAIEKERVFRLGHKQNKMSGIAIRTIDEDGRLEIAMRIQADEIAALTNRMFCVLALFLAATAWGLYQAGTEKYLLIAELAFLFFWPVSMTAALRWLRSPSVIKPAAALLPVLVGGLVWDVLASPTGGAVRSGDFLVFLILEGIALAYPIRLVRRAWDVADRFDALISTPPTLRRRISRVAGYAAWGLGVIWALGIPSIVRIVAPHGDHSRMGIAIANDVGISEAKQGGADHLAKAEQAFKRAVDLAQPLVSLPSADSNAYLQLEEVQFNLATALASEQKYAQSVQMFESAKETVDACWFKSRGCPLSRVEDLRTRIEAALAVHRRQALPYAGEESAAAKALRDGTASFNKIPQDLATAEAHFVSASRIFRSIARIESAPPEYEDELMAALYDLGLVYFAQQRLSEAEDSFMAALVAGRQLSDRFPQYRSRENVARQAQTQLDAVRRAVILKKVTSAQEEISNAVRLAKSVPPQFGAAEKTFQAAVRDWKELADRDPIYRPALVQAYFDLGWIYLTQQKFSQAEKPLRSSLKQLDLMRTKTPEQQSLQAKIASILSERAMNHPGHDQ